MAHNLYILSGLPGSGKSTFAKKVLMQDKSKVYVSRDEIRFSMLDDSDAYFKNEKKVFDEFTLRIAEGLFQGHDVIADATHLNMSSRNKLINALLAFHAPFGKIFLIIMDTPLETCIDRQSMRDGREKVPQNVIENMAKNQNYASLINEKYITKAIVVQEEGEGYRYG